MKNFTILFLLLAGLLSKAQQTEFINNTWFLQEMKINGVVYLPPENEEYDNVWLEIDKMDETYFFHSEMCSHIGGMLNWISNDQFSFFDFAGGYACEDPENQDFEYEYAYFYGYGGFDGIPLDYVINTMPNGSLELIVTNRFGNTLTYTNENLSVFDHVKDIVGVYPNPVTDIVTLGNIDTFGKISVRIYNISGKLMINQNLDEKRTIDLSHLESGVYFMNVLNESNKIITTKKLIKK